MYGITDHYFQTLHDFNSFGEGLEAFLPEQALRAIFIKDFMSTLLTCSRQAGKLRFNQVSGVIAWLWHCRMITGCVVCTTVVAP